MSEVKPLREPMILTVEDGCFTSPSGQRMLKAPIIGVLTSGTFINRVIASAIDVDGLDVTSRIIEMGEKVGRSMKVILLHGLPYGGFNIVDVTRLYNVFERPVITVINVKPDPIAVEAALKLHFQDWEHRMFLIKHAGPPIRLELPTGFTLYFEVAGMQPEAAGGLIRNTTFFGKVPEPLRIAKIIADSFPPLDYTVI